MRDVPGACVERLPASFAYGTGLVDDNGFFNDLFTKNNITFKNIRRPKGPENRHWAPKTRIATSTCRWQQAKQKQKFLAHTAPGVARTENSSSSRVRAELRERLWDPGRHFPSAVFTKSNTTQYTHTHTH